MTAIWRIANPLQLRPIDGGTTWYADNGFTVPVTSGFDSATFYEIGCWPAVLPTSTEYAEYQDLGFNAASLISSASDQTLAAAAGVWWCTSLQDATVKTFVTAAGAETPILNTFDEPSDWVTDISNYMTGTSGNLSSPTSTTKANGRPHWMNLTFHAVDHVLNSTPSPTTVAAQYSSTVTDRGGATRHVDLASIDNYWISSTTDPFGASGVLGLVGLHYRLSQNPFNGGTNNNVIDASTPVTIPTSFPTSVTFTTSPNRGFQLGAACLVANNGATSAMIGTITAYSSTTGSMTINVTANRTYTAGLNSSGSQQIFLPAGGADAFIWTANTIGGTVTDVTNSGRIPANTTVVGLGTSNTQGYIITVSNNVTVLAGDTIAITQTSTGGGTGPFSGGGVHVSVTADQCRRITHYGATVDILRGYQYGAAGLPLGSPIGQFLDVLGPYFNQFVTADYVMPAELNGMAWVHIMHGGRRLHWFNSTKSGVNTTETSVQSVYCKTPQGNRYVGGPANTISTFNQMKVTNRCIKKLAPVINSQFVMNYATVSPNGFVAPWPTSYATNPSFALATFANPSVYYNADLACVNGHNVASWEVATKYYTGATDGSTPHILVQNKYYLMIAFRGGRTDSPSLTVSCTIGTSAATVTRLYMDCVIDAGSDGGTGTRVQVASTNQMSVGDTVLIENTTGVTGLNGTFTIINIPDATHVDVNHVFSGTLILPRGTILVTHDINPIGLTFQDTFEDITDVRIYRVN